MTRETCQEQNGKNGNEENLAAAGTEFGHYIWWQIKNFTNIELYKAD